MGPNIKSVGLNSTLQNGSEYKICRFKLRLTKWVQILDLYV